MSMDQTVSFSLEVNVEHAETELRRLQTVLYRSLGLLGRMGLPENINELISYVQRVIAVVNQLRLAVLALQAASGPIGWALAGIGLATSWMVTHDMIAQSREYEW